MHEPFRRFQTELESLRRCDSGSGWPHVYLPRDDYQRAAYIPEESLPTKAACVRQARARLQSLYDETVKRMRVYSDPCSAGSFPARFQAAVSRRLSALRDVLGQCRTPDCAAIINRIMPLLASDKLFSAVETVNTELCAHYALPPVEHYFALISYDANHPGEFEEGLAKLAALAFIRHGYDLLNALQALETDATALLQRYKDAFDARASLEIERHIIAPIQNKLPLLRSAMEKER